MTPHPTRRRLVLATPMVDSHKVSPPLFEIADPADAPRATVRSGLGFRLRVSDAPPRWLFLLRVTPPSHQRSGTYGEFDQMGGRAMQDIATAHRESSGAVGIPTDA